MIRNEKQHWYHICYGYDTPFLKWFLKPFGEVKEMCLSLQIKYWANSFVKESWKENKQIVTRTRDKNAGGVLPPFLLNDEAIHNNIAYVKFSTKPRWWCIYIVTQSPVLTDHFTNGAAWFPPVKFFQRKTNHSSEITTAERYVPTASWCVLGSVDDDHSANDFLAPKQTYFFLKSNVPFPTPGVDFLSWTVNQIWQSTC